MAKASGEPVHIYVRKVQVQGNQHVVNLPRDVRLSLDVDRGDYIGFRLEGKKLTRIWKVQENELF